MYTYTLKKNRNSSQHLDSCTGATLISDRFWRTKMEDVIAYYGFIDMYNITH